MSALQITALQKRYGSFDALSDVSLTVMPGEFHGLIGPNGSGKSSFLKCIAGAHLPTAGRLTFAGRDITDASPRTRVRAGMSIKFQTTSIIPELTVYDHMLLACQSAEPILPLLLSRSRAAHHDRITARLREFWLADRADHRAGNLSHGEQQWLEIAMAMALEPRLLLLDEPTAGMSVEERRMTGTLLAPLRGRCAIIIVEHDLDFIRGLVDRITVLDQGRVLATGTVAEIQANERVQNVYLKRS